MNVQGEHTCHPDPCATTDRSDESPQRRTGRQSSSRNDLTRCAVRILSESHGRERRQTQMTISPWRVAGCALLGAVLAGCASPAAPAPPAAPPPSSPAPTSAPPTGPTPVAAPTVWLKRQREPPGHRTHGHTREARDGARPATGRDPGRRPGQGHHRDAHQAGRVPGRPARRDRPCHERRRHRCRAGCADGCTVPAVHGQVQERHRATDRPEPGGPRGVLRQGPAGAAGLLRRPR